MKRRRYLPQRVITILSIAVGVLGLALVARSDPVTVAEASGHAAGETDYWPMVFVFLLSTFIGLGVIRRVSRLLHTPLMSLTNAISAVAVVGAILIAGPDYPPEIRLLGGIALFASVTNIVSGFLITDRMLKMFKRDRSE
ncbi:MAG: NAD(P) transhydrogenase subunit alpha [Gammaproteobacteria bacterium]|nr:NAD(P) transhydrogenase subunit alpha [Gammaproteobacteria bacterium]MDE0450336.1 NAD(P) transhydrogenase subunit alpha [Gammaproteobacteria bacterium]